VITGAVLAGATVARGATQAKPTTTAKPAAQTTLSGVYTAAQASKGEDMYYGICISCHAKGYYTGPSFKKNWSGRPLSDLYDWVLNKMPKNDPGSLTPDESVEVIAYILQQNKMPAGKVALPANWKALFGIKIQLK
jgi:cytochrome c5